MDTRFYKGIRTKEEKAIIKNQFDSAQGLRKLIIKILESELTVIRREMRDPAQFEKASWSEYIAFRLGEDNRINKLIKLLSDQTEEK